MDFQRSVVSHVLALACALVPAVAHAQAPLSDRTLVVYNSRSADSLDVAKYYMAARGIPPVNMCGIAPTATAYLVESAFESTVKEPIKGCLNAVGPDHILYIVFSYLTPYRVTVGGRSFSLDQAIADIWDEYAPEFPALYPDRSHPYFADAQSQGNVYPRFVSFADYRRRPDARMIYSVWRLDAANAALARGLVDKAIQAETNGLEGIGCFDRRYFTSTLGDNSYASGDWDIFRAADIVRRSGFTVVEDQNSVELGTAPAPLRCDGAAFYSGWYSYNRYFDVFTWVPGAMGFHLDSASALDPRGGANWAANAILRGITVTSGAVSEPYLEGLIHPDGFFRDVLEGANVGDAALRNTAWLKWRIINLGDPLYRPVPGGRPPFNPPGLERALFLEPRYVVGGKPSQGVVVLDAPAPPGGASVALTGGTSKAKIPASVMIPEGEVAAAFPITTSAVTASTAAIVRATYSGLTSANTLVVLPLLDNVDVSPTAVPGGLNVTVTVYLNEPAGPGGVAVSLTSADPAVVSAPSPVLVAEGSDRAAFTAATFPVSASRTVNITTSLNGTSIVRTLSVRAATIATLALAPNNLVGGGGSMATATLTGSAPPGGLTLTLTSNNPAGAAVPAIVAVAPGATTVTFPVATRVVNATTSVSIAAVASGVAKAVSLIVQPPISTVWLSSLSVVGGSSPSLSVALKLPAGAGGVIVELSSSNPVAATVPAALTVPAGATSASVKLVTVPTSTVSTSTLSATVSGITRAIALTVKPPSVSLLSISPAVLKGGWSATGRVNISGPAPPESVVIALASSDPAVVIVPATITIAPGATYSAAFTIRTPLVAATISVTVTATYQGTSKTAAVKVNP